MKFQFDNCEKTTKLYKQYDPEGKRLYPITIGTTVVLRYKNHSIKAIVDICLADSFKGRVTQIGDSLEEIEDLSLNQKIEFKYEHICYTGIEKI